MSFIDLLRSSRTGRIPVLHKFLTQYDPNTKRIYAFVEGHADQAFYGVYIEPFADGRKDVCFYNCEGKKNVYAAYSDVVSRCPACERVLFFVDKDIDDILGHAWPTDPRIFVTDCYSIENYIVRSDCLGRYLSDFVKIKRVDVDLQPALDRFEAITSHFHKLITPIMAWILVMRRGGNRVILNDVNLTTLFVFTNTGISRRPKRRAMEYLHRVTGTPARSGTWRQVRAACVELRSLPPKRYVRGKFEIWCFVELARQLTEGLTAVAREGGGGVYVGIQLCEATSIQLFAPIVPIPASLDRFLRFHLARGAVGVNREPKRSRRSIVGRIKALFK